MSDVEAYEGEPGCSPSTHAWFSEVYAQVRQMAYDLRLEELHEVARSLEDVHRIVHPPLQVRLSVPRGPDERARMSRFVDEVMQHQAQAGAEQKQSEDHPPHLGTQLVRMIEGDPADVSDVPSDNPSDETF